MDLKNVTAKKHRSGKGSQQRNYEKYKQRRNEEEAINLEYDLCRRLCLSHEEAMVEVKRHYGDKMTKYIEQQVAKCVGITSRAVGFVTATVAAMIDIDEVVDYSEDLRALFNVHLHLFDHQLEISQNGCLVPNNYVKTQLNLEPEVLESLEHLSVPNIVQGLIDSVKPYAPDEEVVLIPCHKVERDPQFIPFSLGVHNINSFYHCLESDRDFMKFFENNPIPGFVGTRDYLPQMHALHGTRNLAADLIRYQKMLAKSSTSVVRFRGPGYSAMTVRVDAYGLRLAISPEDIFNKLAWRKERPNFTDYIKLFTAVDGEKIGKLGMSFMLSETYQHAGGNHNQHPPDNIWKILFSWY